MKKIFTLMAAIAIAFTFISCGDDETPIKELTGKNMVKINFDNSFNGNDLTLGVFNSDKTAGGEKLKITAFDYILSNFVLITEEGKEVPYQNGYFILSEGGEGKVKNNDVMLKDIPAGKYTKVRFGIGIDQQRYLQGQDAQENFWAKAQEYAMTWSWQAGYKFVVLEGDYKTDTATEDAFRMHIASRGSKIDLYKEVVLDLPSEALVSSDKSPLIHVMVDAIKMLNGSNKIKLEEGSTIMGGDKAGLIAVNNMEMFKVHHVHNGSGDQHN